CISTCLSSRAPLPSLLTPTSPTDTSTLSLHDALPISDPGPFELTPLEETVGDPVTVSLSLEPGAVRTGGTVGLSFDATELANPRSEEHTSELQSRFDLVCRLLLEKKTTSDRTPETSPA